MNYGNLKNYYNLPDLSTDTKTGIISQFKNSTLFHRFINGEGVISKTLVDGINLTDVNPGPNYLTFTAEQDNSSVRFCHLTTASTKWTTSCDVEYSLNSGQTWIDYGVIVDHSGTLITLSSGQSVCFRNKTERKYGGFQATATVSGNNVVFKMTGKIRADGNINSLIDKSATCDSINASSFCYLFSGCTSLTKAPELPALSFGTYTYYYMFIGCTGLIDASILLPAKCVPQCCYERMFQGCSNLKYGPFINADYYIPKYSFKCMFYGCSKLESVGNMVLTAPSTENTANWLYGTTSTTVSPRIIYLQSGTTWNPAANVTGVPPNWTKIYI